MGTARRCVVFAAIAFCVAVSLFDIVVHHEQWPFSHYPMYAGVARADFTMLRLYGVTGQGDFAISGSALAPFGLTRLTTVFDRLVNSGDRRRLQSALDNVLLIYRRSPQAVPVRSICLYRMAGAVDSHSEIALSRTLISCAGGDAP